MAFSRAMVGFGAVVVGTALALVSGAPAQAADPTIDPDGVVVVGDAQWQFDEYGLAYGWDAADVYDSDGYIFYPAEFYVGSYLYCGDDGPPVDAAVGVDSTGALTIVCPSAPWGVTGLTASLEFRVYPQAEPGYLLRQVVTITNGTAAPIDVQGALEAIYYDGYTGEQGTPGFLTSLGDDTVQSNDTWFISSRPSGTSVVETEAWARTGSAPAAGIDAHSGPGLWFSDANAFFAPGETKRFLTFTNMVIPATADEAGAAAAFAVAADQTAEFASFSGRLVEGLPEGVDYIGWGVTPVTPVPALAATGAVADGTAMFAVATALLLLAGGAMLVARRRAVVG